MLVFVGGATLAPNAYTGYEVAAFVSMSSYAAVCEWSFDADGQPFVGATGCEDPVGEACEFAFDVSMTNGHEIYGDCVGIKVPEGLASKLLSEKHIVSFRPLGKPKMREWIQINRTKPADYRRDIDIFYASVEFVRQIPTTKRRKKWQSTAP
jgi:hypothetical protein